MVSSSEACNNVASSEDNQLTAISEVLQSAGRVFYKSIGAMTVVMGYLTRIEQLALQGLSQWWYEKGVRRVQWSFKLMPQMFYFVDDSNPEIIAIRAVDEHRELFYYDDDDDDEEGYGYWSSVFSNDGWISCQVGQSRLFQAFYATDGSSSFRVLKVDRIQGLFTIEREEEEILSWSFGEGFCLAHFKLQFVFLINGRSARRYSLSEDRWEKLLCVPSTWIGQGSACSLADKVYVFSGFALADANSINVLHNPGATISSQELHWQMILVPKDVSRLRFQAIFVPLNSTEIVILGGLNGPCNFCQDSIIFNTITSEFDKKEIKSDFKYHSGSNQSANVCENSIIATYDDYFEKRLLKYTKGCQMPSHLLSDSESDWSDY